MESTRLVGRDAELALLREQLRRARQGEARIVFVRGEAGIGKTALVRALVAEAPDFAVLSAAGEETETSLHLGVADQLLARTPGPRPPPAGPFAAGAALVGLVSDMEARQPVLLWVDDVHWVDPASQQALLFALRRLGVDPVCTVLGFRALDDPAVATGFRRLHRESRVTDMVLHGLDVPGVRDLARLSGVDLPVGAVRRLTQHTSGNPLWSSALLKELSPQDLSSLTPDLPAPEELRTLVLGLLRRASDGARRLVEASAVAGSDWPLGLLAGAAGVSDAAAALGEGVAAGLLVAASGSPPDVRPAHALIRAAVVSSLTVPRRLELHARLAEHAPTPRQRLRHLIAASPGADDALAHRAAEAAADAGARGDLVGATELLASAARLGTDPVQRGQLLDEAVATGLLSGDLHQARSLTRSLGELEQTPRRLLLRAWLALSEGRHRDAEAGLTLTLDQAAALGDGSILPEASRLMAHLLLLGGREREAVEHARRAVALETPATLGAGMARAVLVTSLALLGRHAEAEAAAQIDDVPMPHQLITAVCRGNARTYVGDWEGAVSDLRAVVEASRHLGISDFLSAAWANLARAQYLFGDWDAAHQNAQQAVEVAIDTDQFWALAPVHATASLVPARRGDWDVAQEHVDAAVAAARTNQDAMSVRYAGTAAAAVAHSRGQPEAVLAAVRPVLESYSGTMPAQPGTLEWPLLYAEALVLTGRPDAARTVLDELEDMDVRTWVTGPLARVRGRLHAKQGENDRAIAALDRAEASAAADRLSFDLALVRLDRGGVHAALDHRAEALRDLGSAAEGFAALGARPFGAASARRLAALGAEPTARASPARPALTPQEVAVSRLVREGLSNREIASELFLSTKTVEFHLRHVFMKLGITSRTQLAARFGEFLELHPREDGRERPLGPVQDE